MKGQNIPAPQGKIDRVRLRRTMEALATFGLILVAVGLIAPFVSADNPGWLTAFKYIYAAGALCYFSARLVASLGKDESVRVRRLRRMEMWAGMCFMVAAFFWFYNTAKLGGYMLSFKAMQETVVFTLAGAVIQIISSWMLASALRKEQQQKQEQQKQQK